MIYHRIQTQREPDIEVLVSETSFAMGFNREGQVVNRWVALPYGGGFAYFGHYLGTVEASVDLPSRVKTWLLEAFGESIALDKAQRNHRFLEEALELVQSLGCTREECHALVDYVYGRPIGEPFQEAGGALLTLAGLCAANDIPMAKAGDTELARVWTKIDLIRLKQASKPANSPLPGSVELVSPSEGGKADGNAG